MRSSSTCTLFDVHQTRFYLVYINFLYKKAIPMYDITFDETACLLFMSILIVLSHLKTLPCTLPVARCSASSNSYPRIGNATACSARLSSCIGFGCRHSRTRPWNLVPAARRDALSLYLFCMRYRVSLLFMCVVGCTNKFLAFDFEHIDDFARSRLSSFHRRQL